MMVVRAFVVVILLTASCVPEDSDVYPYYRAYQDASDTLHETRQELEETTQLESEAGSRLEDMQRDAQPRLMHDAWWYFLERVVPVVAAFGIVLTVFGITAIVIYGRQLGPVTRRFLHIRRQRFKVWRQTGSLRHLARKLRS